MKAAVLHAVGDLRFEEVDTPPIGEDDVLLEVKACGVCGTDLHFFKGEWIVKTPLIMGHEFSGQVVETGEMVEDLSSGDPVVVDPNIACGRCFSCRSSDKTYLCENIEAIGVDRDGGFAEYLSAPRSAVYPMLGNVGFEAGAFTEPVACCLRGVDKVGMRAGSSVAIIGAGPIGLLLLQLLRISGASKVMISDLLDYRLEKARELGADVVINARREDVHNEVLRNTDDRGADVVFEAVGSAATVEQAIRLARRGAHVCLFGVCPQDAVAKIKPFELYDKELLITTAYRDPFTFSRALALLTSKRVDVTSLITHRFRLGSIEEAFETFESKRGNPIKLLVLP